MRYFSLNAVVEGRYLIIFFVIFLQYEYVKNSVMAERNILKSCTYNIYFPCSG